MHGLPLRVEPATPDEEDFSTILPVRDAAREVAVSVNRTFWQRFIDEVQFDHPDQSRPTHGGDNWVKTCPSEASNRDDGILSTPP